MFISDPGPSQRLPILVMCAVLLIVGCYPNSILNVIQSSIVGLLR